MACNSKTLNLSKRGQKSHDKEAFLGKFYQLFEENKYDKETNPSGIVNIGTSENHLTADLLQEKFSEPHFSEWTSDNCRYSNHRGVDGFRDALSAFMTERFKTCHPIKSEHLCVGAGAGTLVENLAFMLADIGEYIMIPTPCYPGIHNDIFCRALVEQLDIPLDSKTAGGPFKLNLKFIQDTYSKGISQGKTIRAIFLINPHNPLGTIYDQSLLIEILDFAASHDLHVIIDELYTNSIFDEEATFTSVLSIPNLPQPEKVHVIWSFSKDFGLSGIRCGVLFSLNAEVIKMNRQYGYFGATAVGVQHQLKKLIQDKEWLDNVYFPTYYQRSRENHEYAYERLSKMGIEFVRPEAGLFIFANMTPVFGSMSFEKEKALFRHLLKENEGGKGGVYIVPGSEMFCVEPGWFRIIVAVNKAILTEGLDRIEEALKTFKYEESHLELDFGALGLGDDLELEVEFSGNSLAGLLGQLKSQISGSDWLSENTTEKFENENPELVMDFKKAAGLFE